MKLILGGAHQGKLDYALTRYDSKATVYHGTETVPEIDFSRDVIHALHRTILAQHRAGMDPLDYIESRLDRLVGKIVICDDISCGVVPTDPELRLWRETVGRVMILLTGHADEVIRVFYGLGTKLK